MAYPEFLVFRGFFSIMVYPKRWLKGSRAQHCFAIFAHPNMSENLGPLSTICSESSPFHCIFLSCTSFLWGLYTGFKKCEAFQDLDFHISRLEPLIIPGEGPGNGGPRPDCLTWNRGKTSSASPWNLYGIINIPSPSRWKRDHQRVKWTKKENLGAGLWQWENRWKRWRWLVAIWNFDWRCRCSNWW